MATIFPGGRGTRPDFVVRYASRAHAIRQFERWATFNWERLPAQDLGHGAGAPRLPRL
ncbi:hypothetical protein [Dyella sp.]|uniref:hypothetical protein n=1 Tax=Dyella sp. TaxID=1869338 RepID=UPI002FDAFDBC